MRVELSRSKTLATMRSTDAAARQAIMHNEPPRYGTAPSQGDSSVQITVSTLTASDSVKEIKYIV